MEAQKMADIETEVLLYLIRALLALRHIQGLVIWLTG